MLLYPQAGPCPCQHINNTTIASNMHRNIDNINGYRMLKSKTDENAFNQPSEKERKQAC